MPKNILPILFFCCLTGALSGQPPGGSGITIREESIRVGELLKEITRQSGADFAYNSRVVDPETVVSFEVENAGLDETLDLLCRKIGVVYTLVEGQVVLNFAPPGSGKEIILSGFLSDRATGDDLIGATVAVKGSQRGTFTNEFGYYALPLPQGKYTISYSYLGYQAVEMELDLQADTRRQVALPPTPVGLPEVIVRLTPQKLQAQSSPGEITLAPELLNDLPEFGGESGLIKGLASLPGIQTHSDGSAFFYARGGERDQNLIVIDDAPIYNPSHLLGFYSLVIPDFAKQITVYKSDMPASMGDRLASIVSIRTKDGNLNEAEFSGSLNPLLTRLSASLPIVKERSSVFVSLRGSNFQWLYQNANSDADIRFWDLHLKWNVKFNEKNRFFFTTILGGDVLSSGGGPLDGIRWGNAAATFRWNHVFGPKLFSNTILYSGNYAYSFQSSADYWKSALGTLSFKTDFTNYFSRNITVRFGLEIQGFYTNPGEISVGGAVGLLPNIASDLSRKGVLYVQNSIDLSPKFQLNVGLRLINWENLGPKTYYLFDEQHQPIDTISAPEGVYHTYKNLDPRLSLKYLLNGTSQLKLSLGVYHQYLQLIQNSISPFTAFEVWLPAGPNIRPQAAVQAALSYQKHFPNSQTAFSAAAYYKYAENQIDYEAHATTYLNPLLESELRFGTTRSYGLELMYKKDFGRLNGWIKYSYARVFRKTDGLNDGQWYRAVQDRPHDLSLVLNYDLSKRVGFTAFWTSHSGSTFTSPTGFYTFGDQTVPLYGERNNDRLPAYHRLDLSFRFRLHKKDEAKLQHYLVFSIYNFLAHPNVFSVKFNKRYSEELGPPVPVNTLSEELLSASRIDLIRFFPSLTYKFEL